MGVSPTNPKIEVLQIIAVTSKRNAIRSTISYKLTASLMDANPTLNHAIQPHPAPSGQPHGRVSCSNPLRQLQFRQPSVIRSKCSALTPTLSRHQSNTWSAVIVRKSSSFVAITCFIQRHSTIVATHKTEGSRRMSNIAKSRWGYARDEGSIDQRFFPWR